MEKFNAVDRLPFSQRDDRIKLFWRVMCRVTVDLNLLKVRLGGGSAEDTFAEEVETGAAGRPRMCRLAFAQSVRRFVQRCPVCCH